MIRRWFRRFGSFVVGLLLITGGGSAIAYGIALFYLSIPGTRSPGTVLAPVDRTVMSLLTHDLFGVTLVVGVAGFALEVRENGLWPSDDRTHQERLKDIRRQWAEEREAWRPPPEDRDDGTSMYEELRTSLAGTAPELAEATLQPDETPVRVSGRIRNDSINRFEDLQVTVQFVGGDGTPLGTGAATRQELGPKETWQFEVFYRGDGQPADFRIKQEQSRA